MKTKLNMKQVREAIAEKSKLIGTIFEEAGADMDFSKVKCLEGADTTAKLEKLHALEAELKDLSLDYQEYSALAKSRQSADESANFPGGIPKEDPGAATQAKKSIGALIKASGVFSKKNIEVFLPEVDLKTDFTTAAGWAPLSQRLPGYVGSPVRAPSVLNFLPQYNTNQHAIKYMLESTYTATNAIEKAEAAALGEVALRLTETTGVIEKIGAYIPVTDEQLEDEDNVEQYLTDRLTLMVRNRIEAEALEGDGSTPNLLGTLHLSAPNSQAKGTDPTPDAMFKGMVLVRSVGFAEPSAIFMNPADWQDIKLLRTADGIYIFGNPMDAGPERMWGVPMCITMAVTAGTAMLGDYASYSAFYWRKGMEVMISSGYSTYFVEGTQAVKVTTRGCMVHFRDKAFCLVTGI